MAASSSSSSQSYNYDVFLSFRGDDTRKTFVDYLYSTLKDRMIHTYKDDETLPRGDSIRPSLFKAIEESKIAIIVFSENYADSSWCLEEMAHIMKCRDEGKLIVMPIFYCVDPSDVRKQKRKYKEAFSKHDKENIIKSESWRKALVAASEIAGWDPKNIANGHEMKAIEEIVDTVSKELFSSTSEFNEYLVGIDVRIQELEAQLELGSGDVRMVGIWGVGGSGKTTLASSLGMKIYHRFQGYCIVENIREESRKNGLKNLQEKIISHLSKTNIELQCVEEGKHFIKNRMSRSSVLLILDDVDRIDQLDALVGSRSWFGSGSRIIITTRNEQLLRNLKVDRVCPARLLSPEEAIQLFNKRAYDASNPIKDYKRLSSSVIDYAAGLPLALKVLGSFLRGRDEKQWSSTLARLKGNPDTEIMEILKISYDGLEPLEKQLFLDIACFFRGEHEDSVTEIFEACGYEPCIGISVLIQKALITIVNGRFDMHDLVQEMGHYIVRRGHPDNPKKHSRVWEKEDIKYLAATTMKKKNNKIEVLNVDDRCVDSSLFYKMISSLKKLRWLRVNAYYDDHDNGPSFLSNKLRYIYWNGYPRSPFPDTFKPMKLVFLIMYSSCQRVLWKGYKHLPHLKVLCLVGMNNLLRTPHFDGLPCLQKLELEYCNQMIEIHSSLGRHTSLEYIDVSGCSKLRTFPTIIQMGKLKVLKIKWCHQSLEFPEIKSNMESLVKLSLKNVGIDALLSSFGDQRCANLISLNLSYCFYFNTMKVNFDGCLKRLEQFKFKNLEYVKMPDRVRISLRHWYGSQLSIWLRPLFPQLTISLQKLVLSCCDLRDGEIPSDIGELSNLRELDLSYNTFTRLHFSLSKLTQLELLNLSWCKRLLEFPELPSRLAILRAEGCYSLKTIGDCHKNCKSLCKVLVDGSNINDGSRLLESMLQGNAIENHYMFLKVEGSETAKGFISPLIKGNRYRLQLPENWCNDYSGFLMCAASSYGTWIVPVTMKHVMSDMESEDVVVWEESHSVRYRTLVWYVSFASLRRTEWWDETYKAVLFSFGTKSESWNEEAEKSGFGVRLIARKSGSGPTQSSAAQERFGFSQDSSDALTFCYVSKYI